MSELEELCIQVSQPVHVSRTLCTYQTEAEGDIHIAVT